MARVKDRLTKRGNTIMLKSHHVLRPRRVLVAVLHHCSLSDGHTHRGSTYGYTGRRYVSAARSFKVLTPSSSAYRYVNFVQTD